MKDKVVLDSSAIAALFFKEDFSDKVEEAIGEFKDYYTVSQAISEVANVAWKKVHIYGEDEKISKEALRKAIEFIEKICEVVDNRLLIESAFEFALTTGITVYDALFVALAYKLGVKLVTTDEKLWRKLRSTEYSDIIICVK